RNGVGTVADEGGNDALCAGFTSHPVFAVSIKTTDYVLSNTSNGNVLFGMSGGSVETSTGILGTSSGDTGSIYSMSITTFTAGQIQTALTNV
ncbi:flagellin, partial [Rhizobium leguminosarum]